MSSKILIVEDNVEKGNIISSVLRGRFKSDIEFARTISSGFAILEHKHWDLVVLDMTFQVSQGLGQEVRKEALAGVELLQFMTGKELEYPVIVATQHSDFTQGGLINLSSVDQLGDLLSATFPQIYRGIIKVDLTSTSWHAELIGLARSCLNVPRIKSTRN